MKVHQFLTSYSYGDAIGNEALEIRDYLAGQRHRIRDLHPALPSPLRQPGAQLSRVRPFFRSRQHGHLSLFHRLAGDQKIPAPGGQEGHHLPQHHALSFFPGFPPHPGQGLLQGPHRAEKPGRQGRPGPGRLRIQPRRAAGGRIPAHRRVAPGHGFCQVRPAGAAGLQGNIRRRQEQHSLCRAGHPQQEDRGRHQDVPPLPKAFQPRFAPVHRRRVPRFRALFFGPAGPDRQAAGEGHPFQRPRAPGRNGLLREIVAPVPAFERARGLLRPDRGKLPPGPPGRGLRRRRRGRDHERRGRAGAGKELFQDRRPVPRDPDPPGIAGRAAGRAADRPWKNTASSAPAPSCSSTCAGCSHDQPGHHRPLRRDQPQGPQPQPVRAKAEERPGLVFEETGARLCQDHQRTGPDLYPRHRRPART